MILKRLLVQVEEATEETVSWKRGRFVTNLDQKSVAEVF